jgi:hypothetical protein
VLVGVSLVPWSVKVWIWPEPPPDHQSLPVF